MRKTIAPALALVAAALLFPTAALAAPDKVAAPPPKPSNDPEPRIQLAILLDTSGSMDGLIDQAKSQLWKIVNEFARAKKDGRTPRLEVALYEYGKDSLPREAGFLRQIVPLTTDLDKVSQELFALRTNGGDEYCGRVIHTATNELKWSNDPSALKMIFIAGNEPFNQGPVAWDAAVKGAIAKNITVNTIHCGSELEAINGKWKAAALLADGRFSTIDHNRAVAAVKAPQDAEIAKLGAELNDTYVGYGSAGDEMKKRQVEQDKNADSAKGGAGVARAAAKASAQYRNSHWDLVDATKEGKVSLDKLDEDALPAELKGKDIKTREKFVAEKAKKRSDIQSKIQKLEAERRTFVAAEEKKLAEAGEASFDDAVIEAVHAQGAKAAYSF